MPDTVYGNATSLVENCPTVSMPDAKQFWPDGGRASAEEGPTGPAGKSAYEVAVEEGFVGDAAAWLASLERDEGPAGDTGPAGESGASAYDIAVSNGFSGDEEAWLASLQGADGADGAPGSNGSDGAPGADGADSIFTEIASQGEAEAGTDNAKGMTPLRTAQAIAALASGGGSVDEKILRYRSYRYSN